MKNEKAHRRIPRLTLPPNFLMYACLAAAIILFTVGMLVQLDPWLKIFVFTSAFVLAGYDIVLDAVIKIVREHDFRENLLVVIAAAGAILIGRAAEGAAVMALFRLGEVVRKKVTERSTNAIEGVMDLRPDVVNAVISGAVVRKAAGKIKEGDVISVAPGERFALDGVVISGESEVDSTALTGVYTRQTVKEGCEVLAGCLNVTGILNVQATREFDAATVSRLLRFVEKDENKKAKPEKQMSMFAGIYTPAAAAAAIIVGVLVPLFGGLDYIPWLAKAFGILVVSGAGVLVLSVALTYFAGIGGAAKKGVLFKGASVVDAAAHATSVMFDMTGTLTTGDFRVLDIKSKDISSDKLLLLGAYAQAYATGPVARAILAKAGFSLDYSRISNFRDIPERGTEVTVGNMTITAGNLLMMGELGLIPDYSDSEACVVYVAVNGKYAGKIVLSDDVRPDAKKAVKDLHGLGIDRIAIFTDESKETASEVAGQLGVLEYYAECRPEEKLTRLKGLTEMQLPGDKLIYIGNGVEDPAVLKTADVGVVLGGLGTSEITEASNMIIMTNEPSRIQEAINLARNTDKIVAQNMKLSLALKGLILLLVIVGVVTVWIAVLADAVASVIAVLNAMRAFGMSGKEIKRILSSKKRTEEEELGEAAASET